MRLLNHDTKLSKDLVVAVVVLGILIYLASGGMWKFLGSLKPSEVVTVDDIKSIEMALEHIDTTICFVDEDHISIVNPKTKVKETTLVKIKKDSDQKLMINPKANRFTLNLMQAFSKKAVQINIPSDFKETLKIQTSSGKIKIVGKGQLSQVELISLSGNIELEQIEASSEIESKSGSLLIQQLSGTVHKISSQSGTIQIESGQGDFTIASQSGKQEIGEIVGNQHKISTLSGDIYIDYLEGQYTIESASSDLELGQVKGYGTIGGVSGDIEIDEVEPTGDINIELLSGDISVGIMKEIQAQIEMKTEIGDIDSDFTVDFINNDNQHASLQLGEQNHPKVFIKTVSGDIGLDEI